jgi:serine/threonine protein phosphatase PrpC
VVVGVDFNSREVCVSHIGDSRAILVRDGKAIALSQDHKPEDQKERARIRAAGGQVIKVGPCHRVDGTLNLSRAFGDFRLKDNSALPPEKQKVIAVPDSTCTTFKGGSQEILVIACDGLFERCSNQALADLVWARYQDGMPLEQIGKELLHACCARPDHHGMPMGEGTDNETVILVKLPAMKAKACKADADGNAFSIGQRVRIQGLETEAGQRLNGQDAIVESTNSDSGRYEVRICGRGSETKSLKAANLKSTEVESEATEQ